jgi:hypothetical protein
MNKMLSGMGMVETMCVSNINLVEANRVTIVADQFCGTTDYPYIKFGNRVIVTMGKSIRDLARIISENCGIVFIPDEHYLDDMIYLGRKFLTLVYYSSFSRREEFLFVFNLNPLGNISLCRLLTGKITCPNPSFVEEILGLEPGTARFSEIIKNKLEDIVEAFIWSEVPVC